MPADVIALTPQLRSEHYWRNLVYVGFRRPARCTCGRGKTHWTVAAQHEIEGLRTTIWRCKCRKRVLTIDERGWM